MTEVRRVALARTSDGGVSVGDWVGKPVKRGESVVGSVTRAYVEGGLVWGDLDISAALDPPEAASGDELPDE